MLWRSITILGRFLSTLSLRRATAANLSSGKSITISIHALLAESDHFRRFHQQVVDVFLSTLSLRRATIANLTVLHNSEISIHALLAESDPSMLRMRSRITGISIHALLAESDSKGSSAFYDVDISIHALLAESDMPSSQCHPDI